MRARNAPEDAELLAYLDGQLDAGRRAQIDRALASSWDLRTRLAEIERDVEAFVRAAPPEPDWEVPDFGELQEHVRIAPGSSAREWNWWRAGAVAVACALALVTFRIAVPPAVSAQEILARTVKAEARNAMEARVASPVVYRKLRVRKAARPPFQPGSALWEVWRPVGSNRFHESVSGEGGGAGVFAEFEQVCAANRLDRGRPLSAAAYSDWIARSGARWTKAGREDLAGGGRASVLTTVRNDAAPKGIVEASLLVRESDWHPVAERVKVRDGQDTADFEVVEEAFKLVAMASLPPSYFSPPAVLAASLPRPPAPAVLPPPVLPPPVLAPPLPALPALPSAELAAAAAEVHFVLHRMGLCQQSSLEINRMASGIELRGTVTDEDSRRRIAAELGHLSHVAVDITIRTAQSAERTPERHAGDTSLSVLSLNDAVSADARALRRLARNFSADDFGQLSLASRWLMHEMFREHFSALRRNTARLEALLEPMVPSDGQAADATSDRADPSDWRSRLVSFCDRVVSACATVHDVFGNGEAISGARLRTAAAALAETSRSAPGLESAVIGRLSGPVSAENAR